MVCQAVGNVSLEQMRDQFGRGEINLREELTKQGQLTEEQEKLLDLTEALSGRQDFDDAELIFFAARTSQQ